MKNIKSPDLYNVIRDQYLLGTDSFTVSKAEAVFEHLSSKYDKMPTAKSFIDWCRRNGHIARADVGEYYWTEPGPYAEEELDDSLPKMEFPHTERVIMIVQGGYMHYARRLNRLPRKLKKRVKRDAVLSFRRRAGEGKVRTKVTKVPGQGFMILLEKKAKGVIKL